MEKTAGITSIKNFLKIVDSEIDTRFGQRLHEMKEKAEMIKNQMRDTELELDELLGGSHVLSLDHSWTVSVLLKNDFPLENSIQNILTKGNQSIAISWENGKYFISIFELSENAPVSIVRANFDFLLGDRITIINEKDVRTSIYLNNLKLELEEDVSKKDFLKNVTELVPSHEILGFEKAINQNELTSLCIKLDEIDTNVLNEVSFWVEAV